MSNEVLEENVNLSKNQELGKTKLLDQNTKIEESSNSWTKIIIFSSLIILISLFIFILFDTEKGDRGKILIKEDGFKKPLADNRNYRVVRFENGLDAILISDPKATKSSASMSVGVGSFMDLTNVQGLAHFCEHMLFLGSKSYPKVGDFEDFLVANSGFSNAFTEAERTTYFFEVDNKGFTKSLKMFSRMFAEPNFNSTYQDKEIDAVNSEHEKNLNSDVWRKRQLLRSLSNPLHPNNKFATGNNQTLRNISNENLNLILHNFYEKYYKSFNMKLAIVSNFTLDQLNNISTLYFYDIRNENNNTLNSLNKKSNIHRNSNNNLYGNLETSQPSYRKEDLGKIIYFKKASVGSTLDLIFSLDSLNKNYKIKPLDYIDYQLKYSGEKSLLNILRKRKLANKIESGMVASHNSFSLYQISVELTNEGFNDVNLILRLIFNYLNLIKSQQISPKVYEEIKRISEVNFKFLEKNDDYSNFLAGLSTSMFELDYQDLLYGDYIHSIYDENIIKNFTNSLNINNSIILIGSDQNINKNTTTHNFFINQETKYEKWYNTEYLENYLDQNYTQNLNTFPVTFENSEKIDPKKSFKLRQENNFITSQSELVKDCRENSEKCESDEIDSNNLDFTPINISDENKLKIFYKIDKTFKVPRINIYMKIITPELKTSATDFLYLNLISNYLEYNLSILLAEAIETGNSISLDINNDSLVILISAYSDVSEKIMKIILDELFKFNSDNLIFEEIIEITKKRLNDEITTKPFQKNLKKYFNKIVKFNNFLYDELLESLNKNKPTFHSFVMAYEKFKSNLIMNLFFYGNIDKDELDKIVNTVNLLLPKNNEKSQKIEKNELEIFSIQNSIHIHRRLDTPITFQIKNDAEKEINHAVTVMYQVGPRDFKKSLYLSAMDKCLGQIFYYNLRTVQQLGYIVHAGYTTVDSILYYRIIVQGSKKSPVEIEKSILNVVTLAKEKIESCSNNFNEIKLSISDRLNKKDDNLKERSNKIWHEISENTYDFNRNKDLLRYVDKLKHQTLLKMFTSIFYENPAKLTIFNYAYNSHDELKNHEEQYLLNENVNVTYTNDFNILAKQDFIHAYKNIKFRSNKNVFRLRNSNSSKKIKNSSLRTSNKIKNKITLNKSKTDSK